MAENIEMVKMWCRRVECSRTLERQQKTFKCAAAVSAIKPILIKWHPFYLPFSVFCHTYNNNNTSLNEFIFWKWVVSHLYVYCSTWLKGAFVLIVLLGLTWIFGLFYVDSQSVFIAYVFTVLNSLQGLFIFVFHCLMSDKVCSGGCRDIAVVIVVVGCWLLTDCLTSCRGVQKHSKRRKMRQEIL